MADFDGSHQLVIGLQVGAHHFTTGSCADDGFRPTALLGELDVEAVMQQRGIRAIDKRLFGIPDETKPGCDIVF